MDLVVLALAKAYVEETIIGGGALKGKNATVQSITPVADGNNVVFAWTLDDGTVKTQTLFVKDGADGISPAVDIRRNATDDGIVVAITDKDGIKQSEVKDGKNGTDGTSPTVTMQRNPADDGVIISITDKDGVKQVEIKDGQKGGDGFAPQIVENPDNDADNYKLDITTKDGTTTTPNLKGGKGADGQGVPTGGATGQILVKKSGTDFDTEWQTPQAGGGVIVTDATPTQGSPNPLQSGGAFDALAGKQDTLAGTQGQLVGFDAQGSAVPVEAPETGVVTFNGRTGAVTPEAGDYTADMVGAVVTVEESTQNPAFAKTYTIKQNNAILSTINIPKDMVVSAANVVENPQNQPAGKYVELTIANATNDKIYINVADLVDAYTAQQNATQVQLEISPTNEISARIVAGSITSTELASNSVTTDKIADGNVIKSKLNQDVLDLFDAKQDKLTGSLGQIVGFDANGNAVAREYEITPDWATFIVEDGTTLNQWRTNAAGGDYERVYIRKNTYRVTDLGAVTNGKYFVFNLTTIGTKKIYAEEGTILRFVGAYLNDTVVEIGYEECPSDLEGYSAEGLTILAEIDSSGNNFSPSCFYNMVNLTNCTAKSSCYAKSNSTSINAIGYNQCKNLIRCSSSMSSGKRPEVTAHVGALVSLGYKDCDKLLQCSGEAVAISDSGTSRLRMFGYETCKDMVQCVGTVNQKYVVIAIAGQSNAVGYDESIVDTKFLSRNRDTNRIKQLAYKNTNNLKIIPLDYCADNVQDMTGVVNAGGTNGTKGLHLPLANLMLDYIPEDYSILVLPVAYGSTGFTNGNDADYDALNMKPNRFDGNLKWGANSSLYQTLRDRIKYVLNLNPENIFAGVVWIQGEDDKDNAADHLVGFEAMTADLFNVLNAENLGGRTPKGNWDRDIWYNIETVAYWYNQGQCQQIWDNYKAWNPNTYVEIPRDVDSNEVGGNEATSRTKPSHYGNNAFTTDIAPRVLQKMIDMNTFGTKGFGIAPKEEEGGTEETIGSTYFPNVPVVKDGEKVLEQSDLFADTPSTVSFTIDVNGKCTLSEDIVTDLYLTKKSHIILGDASKLDFEVKRSLYWLVLERDKDADTILVVGFGTRNTGLVSKIVGTTVEVVSQAPGNLGQNFPIGTRVRVYRNVDSSVSIYYKLPTSTSYVKWFDVEAYGLLPDRTFGFACGISSYETNGAYNGELNVLFDTMHIQESTPYPNYQIYDIKISELEELVSYLSTKVTELEQAQSP